MDRKERIKVLQIENRRRLLCKDMQEYIEEISVDNFVSLENTVELTEKILKHMEYMNERKLSVKKPWDYSYEKLFKENMDILLKNSEQNIIFFHYLSHKIGAIEIKVSSMIKNIDYILSLSDMKKPTCCDVFAVSKDMSVGLCIWRAEYELLLYKWEQGDC